MDKFIVIALTLYFTLRIDIVNGYAPGIWAGILLPIIISSFLYIYKLKKITRIYLLDSLKWFLPGVIVALYNYITKNGDERLDNLVNYITTGLFFLVVAYYLTINGHKLLKYISRIFLIHSLISVKSIALYLYANDFNRSQVAEYFLRGQSPSQLIFLWVLIGIYILISVAYITGNKKINKIEKSLIICSCILWVVTIFFSTFSGGIVILSIGFIIYLNKTKKIRSIFTIILIGLIIILPGIVVSSDSNVETSTKLGALSKLLKGDVTIETINKLTSNRLNTVIYSLQQFRESPLYGHGYYSSVFGKKITDYRSMDGAAGGHNFFIDLLAYGGISSVVYIFGFIHILRKSKKLIYLNKHNKIFKECCILYSIVASIILINILNAVAYFSVLDHMIYLLFGYIIGQSYLTKMRIINKNCIK